MKNFRSVALLGLKILVSLGLLAILVTRVDLRQLFRVLVSADLAYLGIILAAYISSQFVSCLRWIVLARAVGFQLPFRDYLSFYFIGMFFNLFAPSTIGGDISRVFYLARDGGSAPEVKRTASTANAFISVVADRAVGMVVLVWMGAAAIFIFPGFPIPNAVRTATYALAWGTILSMVAVPLVGRFLRREGDSFRNSVREALEIYWKRPSVLAQTVLLSLVVHIVQGAIQKLLGFALDLDLPWSFCFILYPLVGVFSALPITFNGIGLREGGYLFLLGLIGVGSEKALAFGLLWFGVVVVDSLIGGLVFILRKTPKPTPLVDTTRIHHS